MHLPPPRMPRPLHHHPHLLTPPCHSSPPSRAPPPHNAKPEFTLQRFLTPILLLFLALLIPARTRTQRWLVSGVFSPAIFYLHWGNLSYG
ncbi:hypothetical protein BGX38DRAFT_1156155, partial [Terfezia claveryi]